MGFRKNLRMYSPKAHRGAKLYFSLKAVSSGGDCCAWCTVLLLAHCGWPVSKFEYKVFNVQLRLNNIEPEICLELGNGLSFGLAGE